MLSFLMAEVCVLVQWKLEFQNVNRSFIKFLSKFYKAALNKGTLIDLTET